LKSIRQSIRTVHVALRTTSPSQCCGSKNTPLTTALEAPVRDTRTVTWPDAFHDRYVPPENALTDCVSSW